MEIVETISEWLRDHNEAVPLIVAIVGVCGTVLTALSSIGAILFTQMRADKRERDRIQGERSWHLTVWARDQRRAAHMTFLAEQHRLDHWMMMYTRVGLEGVVEPKEDWASHLAELLLHVQVFSTQEAAVAALRVYKATLELETGTVGAMIRTEEALQIYRHLVQQEMGLAPTDLPVWGTEDDPKWKNIARPKPLYETEPHEEDPGSEAEGAKREDPPGERRSR
jgi:hypothetical protein